MSLDHLIPISIICPKTRSAVSLDVPGDVASLARIWRLRKSVKCPHCGETHSVRVCDAYVSTMTSDNYLRWLAVEEQFDDRPPLKGKTNGGAKVPPVVIKGTAKAPPVVAKGTAKAPPLVAKGEAKTPPRVANSRNLSVR